MNAKILADFPILKDIIYMDNAATSLTPEPVLEAALNYYRKHNANVGRGVHRLTESASQMYEDAHKKVAEFINAREEEVIFTKNTTEAINMVAYGLKFKKGDEVVTTLLEHHSNFLPWLRLMRDRGVVMRIIEPNRDGVFDLSDFDNAISSQTRLVAVSHISNVLGTVSPIKEIAARCKSTDALFLVDGAQSVPHIPIDVKALDCDYLAFSGHKMLGPTGTGVFWVKNLNENELEPSFLGGGMVKEVSVEDYRLLEGYEGFEAGTPNIAGGIGLGRAVDYLNEIGMGEVRADEERLARRLLEGLQDIERVQVYGPTDLKERVGIVSFNINGLHPDDVARRLDRASAIIVRSGHHCCMPLMTYLGLKKYGTVRASLYLYNTEEEIDTFLETIKGITRDV